MERQVFIAQAEPLLPPQLTDRLQGRKTFIDPSPALFGMIDAGQVVEDSIQIWANRQAPVFKIISSVDNHAQAAWGQCCLQTSGQFGPPHTAGQRDYM